MSTLGTEESDHRREVETTVNVRTICQKSGSFVEVGFDCVFQMEFLDMLPSASQNQLIPL